MTNDTSASNPREVYLDNAATTRVSDEVAEAICAAMQVDYGNPSSAHRLGGRAQALLEAARERLARVIGAEARDVYFTSGGTEANALGVLGVAGAMRAQQAKHAVVSAIEHPSVLEAARRLAKDHLMPGWTLDEVLPERDGALPLERLVDAVREDTVLVAVMRVHNELGTVQPIFEAAHAIKARAPRAHLHVDAVQALGKLPLDVQSAPIDSLAVSAHKIHGPKGAGALWLRRGARLRPFTVGGGQERGLRPGTENLPGIVGLGLAAELAERARPEAMARMTALRARLIEQTRAHFPALRENGAGARVAPHILSLGFPGVAAEPLLHALEARGVYVSAGSACASKDRKPSAALRAIGVPDHTGVLRFSFSRDTTERDLDYAARALRAALAELGGG